MKPDICSSVWDWMVLGPATQLWGTSHDSPVQTQDHHDQRLERLADSTERGMDILFFFQIWGHKNQL